jgi:hypothetical protein
MDCAFVSVTRNGSWREENIRSALRYSAHVPVVVQYCRSSALPGRAMPSCMA